MYFRRYDHDCRTQCACGRQGLGNASWHGTYASLRQPGFRGWRAFRLPISGRGELHGMDVPVRSAFVMEVVTPAERAVAASFTAVPRSLACRTAGRLRGLEYYLRPDALEGISGAQQMMLEAQHT